MSSVFSKKEKRPRTSSNEANTSFVKNVTSRVTGLLPSTITKWFSSPSSSSANGSAPTAEATDSSTEDEAPETPVITQPPAKRMRYTSPGKYNNVGDARCSTSSIEITEIPYSQFTGSQFSQTSRSSIITSIRAPHDDRSKEREKDKPSVYKPQHTMSSIGQSVATKRKSIFATNTEEEPTKEPAKTPVKPVRESKPSFKPSLLGSPFYPGRTMYGGAASSYINQPNIKQETVAVVNEAKSNNDEDSALSSAARKIMELLDSYSTPLSEARRVPLYTRPLNTSLNTSTDRFSPYKSKAYPYKTQELHVPSYASILRLKQKSRLMDTTNAARQIIASHSSASNYPPITITTKGKEPETIEKNKPEKMTTKVVSRITRTNRGNQDEMEVATPVKLPTATLLIDSNNLPKFSFGTPCPSQAKVPVATATSTPKVIFPAPEKKVTEVSTASKPETVTSSLFTFSKPVMVSNAPPNVDSTQKFTFGSPERAVEQKLESKCDNSSVVVGVKESSSNKEWQCPDCWVKNKPEADKCVCCAAKKPSQKPPEKAKCTVCKLADSQPLKDKCVNCEKAQSQASIQPGGTGASQLSKWKCEGCWVNNDASAAKCVCCGATNPNKSNEAPATTTMPPITNTFGSVATSSNADWKCSECWIVNKSTAEKCAACFTPKPEAKSTTATSIPPPTTSYFGSNDSSFKIIAKTQKSDKWECGSCLVQNDKEKDKCACCGAEKEGEKEKKLPESKFNFNSLANNSFKFGIDPKMQESAGKKKSADQCDSSKSLIGIKFGDKKEQSETNNNVLSETPTFTFASNKLENKIDAPKVNSFEAPKAGFTFGIPKPSPLTTETKKSEPTKQKEDEEKPQEVPTVDLTSPVLEKPNTLGNMFGVSSNLTNNKKSETKLVDSADDTKKTEPSGFTLPSTPASKAEETPKPSFTFGLPSSTKVFGAPDTPATTTASVNLFAQPAQSASATTTSAPSLPMFTPPTTSGVSSSLFQKPAEAAKPASLFPSSEKGSTATTAPMFSFGSNTANNPPAATSSTLTAAPAPAAAPAKEVPKFQFTFGSTSTPKTEPSTTLFPTPFGATESNTSNTNAFALPSGSSLGTGNASTSNALGGINGLPGTNGLSGNTMTGGSLGSLTSNPLTGSTMGGNTLSGGSGAMTNNLGAANGLPSVAGGNGIQAGSTLSGGASLFGQKDNVWGGSNNAPPANPFVSNTATNSLQKPPGQFTFGSTTPFNAPSTTPAFGNNAAAPQNIFGMGSQSNNTQPTLFSNSVPSQPTGNPFGSPPAASSTPQMDMFASPNIGATPTFGSPTPSIPSFEAPSLTPAPAAPAFNFGAPPSTGIFGFGQQPMGQAGAVSSPAQAQGPVYSFGGAPAGAPPVQFSIGSGANTAVRRVRKAVRRNPQR